MSRIREAMRIEVDAVFLDHDGLLVETELLFYEVTRELLLQEGVVLSREWWAAEYLGKGRSSTSIATELGLDEIKADPLLEERNRRYYELLETQPPLCPFAREILQELKSRFPIALVTGNSRRAIETVHRSTGLLSLFDVVVTQEDFERSKPYPDSYLCAAGRLAVDPRRCVAVEDSERGMRAALAAGMTCIAVPGLLTRTHGFEGALTVLPTLEGLPELLVRAVGIE